MKRVRLALLVLLAAGLAAPAGASDFVVLAAVGAVEPEGLEAGRELASGTPLRLEPWGRVVVRESAGCGLTQVIAGAAEHRLAPVEDCSTVAEPLQIAGLVQQGAAFAAPLAKSSQSDDLVQMLVNEPCVFLARVSDEGGNARRCPSGYALRGLRCSGEFCDHKDLLCCPYLEGAPDPSVKELKSRVISEEFPNVLQSKNFLYGLACNGPFCDNILPYPFKSSRLANAGECAWSAWTSELPDQWLDCGAGRLVSGLRCRDHYCGDPALYCCAGRAR